MNKDKSVKKIVLLILDGWGIGKNDIGNPMYMTKTPFIDSLKQHYPWTTLCASEKCVGLPSGQPGNSEAGHLNLGAGRVVDQDVIKISKQIDTGEFFKNPAFILALNHAKKNKSSVHLMGLIADGESPHCDPDHLLALLTFFRQKKFKKVYLHLFTDGRDSAPRSALKSIEALERFLLPNEKIATVIGRFYAMDRKKYWSRTLKAYDAMTLGFGHRSDSPQAGITRAYNANITDEYIEPIVMYEKGKMIERIGDKDAIIFFNLRSDRARQLTKPFVQVNFEKKNPGTSKRKEVLQDIVFVAMTDFGPDLDSILSAYPSEDVKDSLPLLLSSKKQVYLAETEKYAHVTFFFNGGYADPIDGEKRILVPSPRVDNYAKTPAMSTAKIYGKLKSALKKFDFICVNIACPDMIGHTGDMKAAMKTVKVTDDYVKKITKDVLKENGVLIITADHGNIEYMLNLKTGEIITEHTVNPVPFILVGKEFSGRQVLRKTGCKLADVAPTILELFQIKKSKLMTGKSLLK